ncbi:DEAD/DEAH box helicase [Corallococcus sp. AS-1-6]|uniref:DEAD/DEAH box helicase n=1 Tax=Corallococcus sp. AS-1-6 TaxID=2874599 RepID=UPI001CBC073F|nr:AAA domain-containing protein [Corallococcus sp. AS-1-6]MBZ4370770.1 AAA family ATPase [Corallococcus sp. AS-1-6]
MKAAEVTGGVPATLRVKSTTGPLQALPAREQEVSLVRSGEQTLLHYADVVCAVEGATPPDTTQLLDVVTSGFPIVAYVAQANVNALVLETRRFTEERRETAPMQIGLDDKVMDDVRSGHKVGGTALDVAAWLEDRLLLPPAPGEPPELRRFVYSGDVDAFRIYGLKVAADIRRRDNKLRIERVVKGGRNNQQRLRLLYAPVSIVDATLAAELHGAVRTTLSEAVAGSDSYLRTWQEYQKIEREGVLRRARTFGSIEYQNSERRRDGGWRFHLTPSEDLSARLALLGDSERFELEAGDRAPAFDEGLSGVPPSTKKSGQIVRRLIAPVTDVNEYKRFIDLAPPDDDDEQPRPPKSGHLYLSTDGDEARLRRRERAEEALRTGRCPMPQLGLLMEGRPAPMARRNRISVDGPKLKPVLRDVFGKSGPTQRQREAIEHALNTPDVCLIQGPPGTGKTKVITAIEHCLAVLADEGVEPSHRILVCAAQHDAVENVAQRTEVFGLPTMKVGRRRRSADSAFDPAQAFVDERAEQLRARTRVPPEAERLSQARNIVLACMRTRSLPTEQANRIRDLVHVLDGLLPPDIRDKALERASTLERPAGLGDPEETEMRVKAARGIRVDEGAFSDDGPVKARAALQRLGAVLTSDERAFLERCAAVELETVPPWLAEGRPLREALIDRLTQPPPSLEPRLDDETQRGLLDILDAVEQRLSTTRAGEEAVLVSYLNDLESDPEEVRRAIEHYTVVLASTLQQAASNEMRRVRGIDEGQTTFESVIVDEAARANPLDLFIPLSMAKRRVVLVGDHRQLPHLLEPDVERQLAEGVEQGTVEKQTLDAVQASLFERMWVLLRALQQKDGIDRTVTLNAQYRMHPVLGAYVSREFYEVHDDGVIESPRAATDFVHDLPGYVKDGVPRVAAWLDVPAEGRTGREVRGNSKSRPIEARAIAKEVRRLIEHDPKFTFGVIAFYSAQVDEIGRAMIETGLTDKATNERGWRVADEWATTLNSEGKTVERLRIGTVDAFQGKEFDVVFLSVTRSSELPGRTDEEQRRKFGHLMLENRLCVAMSRQHRLLVVVGDLAFVRADDARKPLRALRSFTDLCGGEHGIVR